MHDDVDLKDFQGTGRLFPLPGVVLFPHVVMPLHIFEPRYRQLTEDALSGDRLVTLVQVAPDICWPGKGEPPLAAVGCLGRILEYERLADGRFNFLLLGRKRVRIVREITAPTLYRQAELEILEDLESDPTASARRDELVGLFRACVSRLGPIDSDLDQLLQGELSLGVLTDILAHALGLPAVLKQQLLDERRVERRAEILCHLLSATVLGTTGPRHPPYPPPISPN